LCPDDGVLAAEVGNQVRLSLVRAMTSRLRVPGAPHDQL
jgi:hypothetical protein